MNEEHMNCDQFRDLIPELAREESSADSAVITALAHAESCRECDALLREAERITAGLRSLAAEHDFDAAPPRVETALLDAFRRQHAPAYIRTWRRTGAWVIASAAGVAAAALLAILLSGKGAGTSPATPGAPEVTPRETNRPAASPRVNWADYAAEGETEEQAAAAYIPLAADFDPSWLDSGAIVRVVLSRPALESLGVPVNAGSSGQMVADMVVTSDGTPEAIRVVDWQASDIQ
jgi:hypothetical protein